MTAMLDPGTVARQWWHETFGRDDAGARTARAQLRRCATVLEVLTVESPHRLSRRLRRHGSPYHAGSDCGDGARPRPHS